MIRNLVLAGSLAAAFVAPASALTVVPVDDFDTEDQFAMDVSPGNPYFGVFSGTAGPSATLPSGLQRTIVHTLTQGSTATQEQSWVIVDPANGNANFSIANDLGLNSVGTVAWTLGPGFIGPAASGAATLKVDVVGTDLDVTAALFVGASLVGSQSFGGAGTLSFALAPAQQDGLSGAGGVLTLRFTGPEAYDTTIDNVRFEVSPIPEPGTWAMLLAGLGVVGLLASRRRRD